MSYYLRVLGGFELLHNDTPIPVASAKQRCLLASLALAIPDNCHRDVLAERLWGGRSEGGASQNLRTALSQLRKQFTKEPVLCAQREQVWLNPDMIEVDALTFKTLLKNHDPQSVLAASEMYRGDFLADVRVRDSEAEQWIADQRGWFRTRALETFVKLSEGSLASGDMETAVQAGRRAVLLDDLAEEAHRALLNALLAANRRGEAVRHSMSMLELFESALGVTPSTETMAVIEKVRQDLGRRVIPEKPLVPMQPEAAQVPPVASASEEKQNLIEQRLIVALSYEIAGVAEIAAQASAEELADFVTDLNRVVAAVAAEWLGLTGANAPDHGVIYFGVDGQTEDFASDAVTAANELSEAIANYRWPNRPDQRFLLRAALDESVSLVFSRGSDGDQSKVIGEAELKARRIRHAAPIPGILISDRLRTRVSGYFKLEPYKDRSRGRERVGSDVLWQLNMPRRMSDRFEARHRQLLPLVGRRSELDLLINRWSDTCEGRGQVVIVRGQPGIGKSRLLHDFRGRLKASGVRPWLFQCTPSGGRTALSPLANMFAGRRRWQQQPSLVFMRAIRRLGVSNPEAIEQLGFISGISPSVGDNPPLSTKEALRRMRNAIQTVIASRLGTNPLCLVVEDIHWADPSTLAELEALSTWIADKPVFVILTARDDSLRAISDASNALDLTLRRLDPAETRALATSLWEVASEDRPTPEQVAFLSEFSDGVPLFLEELALWRLQVERSVGTSPALRTDAWGDPAMPVNDLLLSRLNALGEGRKVAQVASAIGRSFDLPMLRAVIGDLLPEEKLSGLLTLLVDQNILRQVWPPPDAEYEFRHAMLREAAYSSLRDADRRIFHRRVFKRLEQQTSEEAITQDADLAWHAERAGNYTAAATVLVRLGRDNAAKSAMAEARSSLSHALELTDHIDDIDARERLQLEVIAALGPLLASHFGPRDERTQQLYDRGVNIARQRPSGELAAWFPVFWGWWYTGSDFLIMHDRAMRVQEMLAAVDDPEVRLQINHCIWAIDFNLGHHRETLEAIETGLALYDAERARMNRTLFGGHDAKVCGLGQKALSSWLVGQTDASDAALAEMIDFVDGIGHIPSKAHSLDTEAVSAFYRGDFEHLAEIATRMGEFAAKYEMEFLNGLSLLFGGWAKSQLDPNTNSGHEVFCNGLEVLEQLGSVADLPIYLYMHSKILALEGKFDKAIAALDRAVSEARDTGHSYWLPELYRLRAEVRAQTGDDTDLFAPDLKLALAIATEQGALALLDRSVQTARNLGIASDPTIVDSENWTAP
jgi:predicted ATPase/DNA-binding SARP family transcriptional activator